MNEKIVTLLEKIKKLMYNYPLVLLFSLATVFVIIYGIEKDPINETSYLLLKLGFVFSLGISLQFALKILSQRIKNGILLKSLGLLFLAAFYFVFPKKEADFTAYYTYILIITFLLSHLLVAFIAFIKKENAEINFWQFNKNLFVNFILSFIFVGVLIIGVELAILAVQNLFNWNIDEKIYFETFVALGIFGSTSIFLLFNDSGLDYLEKEGSYPIVLKFFTQFILIPLLLIYIVILYLYTIKIIINWELPRGWVSYLVIAYAVVGILALLLVHPLKQLKLKSWIVIFSKIFYFTLIPIIVLLFTAIFTRLLQYGYTEPRYFVLLISVWLTLLVFYFIFYKKASIKFIPFSLFLFGLFALIFPYFNAFSVSKRSQEKELIQVLAENDLLTKGKIDFKKPIVDSVRNEVVNKLDYLTDRTDDDFFEQILDDSLLTDYHENKIWYYNLFENVENTNTQYNSQHLRINAKTNLIPLQDYKHLITQEYVNDVKFEIENDKIHIYNINDNNKFEIGVNNTKQDIMPAFLSFCKKHENNSYDVLVDEISVTRTIENYEIKVIVTSIDWNKNNNTCVFNNINYLIKKN